MEDTFSTIKDSLINELNKVEKEVFTGFNYLIKADISGIQDFIFYVKSEKAAKTLKGRSFFIHSLGLIIQDYLTDALAQSDYKVMFNGGGNVYLLSRTELDLTTIRQLISRDLKQESIYVHLAQVQIEKNKSFGFSRRKLEEEIQKEKYQAFKNYAAAFEAFEADTKEIPWSKWTKNFVNHPSGGFHITREGSSFQIAKNKVQVFDSQLELDSNHTQFAGSIVNKLPLWNKALLDEEDNWSIIEKLNEENDNPYENIQAGNIIEFEALAHFAYQRTRTRKLGILKMDVDNLGVLFGSLGTQLESKKMSTAMSWFYDQFFYELWATGSFSYQQKDKKSGNLSEKEEKYRNNLYVVFAGGDDCFVVGAWDAVFHFALQIRKEFAAFVQYMQQQLPKLPKKITISGGLVVVNPKFPALQFAKIAEKELEIAKEWSGNLQDKDRISVFGEALSWEEFSKAKEIADILHQNIATGEFKRSILDRIKKSAIGYEKLQSKALNEQLKGPKVWRLFHFIGKRKSRNNNTQQQAINQIIKAYANSLMDAYVNKKGTSHMVFPVAARWAEFMTANR